MISIIFDHLHQTRKNIIEKLDQYSLDQLNHIPAPLNNNLIWNAAHILVTQQLLCYRLSGLRGYVDDAAIEAYRKGTKPDGNVTDEFVNQVKTQLTSTAEQIVKDYENGLFKEYQPYTTSYGTHLTTVEEAIAFNNIHEGMHIGTMNALRKLV